MDISLGYPSLYPVRDLIKVGNATLIEERSQRNGKQHNKSAVTFFSRAYQREPHNTIVIYNLANAYHYQGDYSKAAALYQEAINIALENKENEILPSLYYNLGNTYFKKDDFGKAVESYKLAMDRDESDIQIKKNYELAFNELQQNKNTQSNQQRNNPQNSDEQKNREQKSKQNPGLKNNNLSRDSQSRSRDQKDTDNKSQNGKNETSPTPNPSPEKRQQGKNTFSSTMSIKRVEQILNSYQNRQKKFESFRKYKQKISPNPNSKNW